MTALSSRPAVAAGAPLAMPADFPKTLPACLRSAASAAPEAGILHVDRHGWGTLQRYPMLLEDATRLLGSLQARGVGAGSVLVLQLSDPARFLVGFWAAVLGGIVPAPLALPTDSPAAARMLSTVCRRLGHPPVLTDKPGSGLVDGQLVIDVDQALRHGPPGVLHAADPEDTALVQFSSGSTGDPKGVVLTHRNLVANIFAIGQLFHPGRLTDVSRSWVEQIAALDPRPACSWLPYTHDMGLIGFHLAPLAGGALQIKLSPRLFALNPALYLRVLHQYRVAYTGSPNSGLEWMLRRVKHEDLAGLDLSCIRAFLNGAEPISVRTLERFRDRFAPHGLDPGALCPVYGLAEASVLVTAPALGEGATIHELSRDALDQPHRAVDEGRPACGVRLRIVDDQDAVVFEDVEGHVQVAGPNVTPGYFEHPEATAAAFCGEWLRTGDRGFLRDGRLVITGRYKDVICVNGRKVHAHDLEDIIRDHLGADVPDLAVCGVPDTRRDRDVVVLFPKVPYGSTGPADLLPTLSRALTVQSGMRLDALVAVDSIPRTTSGKLQRYRLRDRLLAGGYAGRITWLDIPPACGSRAAAPAPVNEESHA
jgi:acyl-CoA synthetase (AMP-forming)/AMP-acid ligase II